MRHALSLWLVLLGAYACNQQVADCGSECACFSSDDCPTDNICFLGTCKVAGYSIQTFYIDLLPPSSSAYLAQPDPENPRVAQGNTLAVRIVPAATLNGQVTSSAPIGGLVAAQAHQLSSNTVPLPSLQTPQQATLTSRGAFTLSLTPGLYDLTLQPTQSGNTMLPPLVQSAYSVEPNSTLTMNYPATGLVSYTGMLAAQPNTLSPVNGAQITGTAVDGNGNRMVAASATTDPNGSYTLQYLPGAVTFSIATHPGTPPGGNPLVPMMTFTPSAQGTPPSFGTQILNIPAVGITTVASVKGADGTPISAAALLFSGSVGPPAQPASFQATATTNSSGVASVTLLAGVYSISVLPQGSDAFAAANVSMVCVEDTTATGCAVNVVDGGTLPFILQAQITAAGKVTDSTGAVVAGARVEFITAVDSTNRRTFATNTDPNGHYSLSIDPGSASAAASYVLSIEPSSTSAVPRYRELLRVGATSFQHDVQIYAPAFVYGSVLDPNGTGVSDVTIALYSAELGSAGQPLLIGLGKSTSGGEFVIPIPTAN